MTQFYEEVRRAEEVYASYQDAIKRGDSDRMLQLIAEEGDLIRARKRMSKASSRLADLNRQTKNILNDPHMSAEDKRERLSRIARAKEAAVR